MSMDLQQIFNAIQEVKGDVKSLDTKMDSHAERIVVVEEKVKSMSGTIKIMLTAVLAATSSIVAYVFQSITGHK